jgi:protocatechuate 3,4-dioxygenase beta subunit
MLRVFKVACLAVLVSCSNLPENETKDSGKQAATIEGSVREAGTDVPITGVSVFLVRTSDQPQARTTTDAGGRFKLEGLTPGRHLVAVVRDGYVVPGRQEISGYPFRLIEGQRVENAVIHMIPSGTISGRVFNPDGKPASRVEVQLLQNLHVMGRQQWSLVNRGGSSREIRVDTNERGEFRALGVDPGPYMIRFVPHEVSVDAVVRGGSSPAPIFYPASRNVSAATFVDVKPGRETLLADTTLKKERRSWIRVLIVNESGEPLEGFGTWTVKPPDWIGSEFPLIEQRTVNNYHEIQPDASGTFDIIATWSTPAGPLAGTARVSYQGADMDLKIPVRKAQTRVTGHVMLQDASDMTRPLVSAEVAIGPKISYFARSGPEGAILFPGVYPGRYQLGFVRGLPPDTYVLSARQGARDVFKDGMVVEGSEASLEVVVSEGAGVLEGKVTDGSGRPAHNALVALVPESPLKDRTDYYGAYRDTRTDQNGEFEIRGITPGWYQSYAWSDAPASAYRNAAFMKPFAGMGTSVRLEPGGKMTVDMKTLGK